MGFDMQLKDSLSGELRPVSPHHVSIYACGITPYSSAHVGHARTYVVFDLLAKVLQAQGHEVSLVRNVTDIDDKIIAAAAREGVSWHELSQRYARENRMLMVKTGLAIPREPHASLFLEDIFKLTQALLDKGHAYVAGSGDVLYRVASFQGPLLMPHKEGSLRSEQGNTRVDAAGKEDLRDFALWKRVDAAEVGFESPWGWGRPGWHIECSAMISSLFGGSVTIHGGGVDLKFPHHQAEIMQSEPVFGRPLADIWMHNGSVLSDGQKMSKSLGNFVTWQHALDQASALVPGLGADLLRVSLLQAHWQKPLDWSDSLLHSTKAELLHLVQGLETVQGEPSYLQPFLAQLSANLNTPAALVWLWAQHKAGRYALVRSALEFLGVDVQGWLAFREPALVDNAELIAQLQAERAQARQNKDWARSDALREQLRELGAAVQDTPAQFKLSPT